MRNDAAVPAGLHLRSVSVLDLERFNPRTAEEGKSHFACLSDTDLAAMNPKDVTAGCSTGRNGWKGCTRRSVSDAEYSVKIV